MKVKVAVMGKDGQTVLGEYAVEAESGAGSGAESGPDPGAVGSDTDEIFERARRAAVADGAVAEADAHLLSFRVVSE